LTGSNKDLTHADVGDNHGIGDIARILHNDFYLVPSCSFMHLESTGKTSRGAVNKDVIPWARFPFRRYNTGVKGASLVRMFATKGSYYLHLGGIIGITLVHGVIDW